MKRTCLEDCKFCQDMRGQTQVCDVICHSSMAIERIMRADGNYSEEEIQKAMNNPDDGWPIFDMYSHNGFECPFYRKRQEEPTEQEIDDIFDRMEKVFPEKQYLVNVDVKWITMTTATNEKEAIENTKKTFIDDYNFEPLDKEIYIEGKKKREPKRVRINLGTYPLYVAKIMREKHNEEKKKAKERRIKKEYNQNLDLEKSRMIFRGRGRRTVLGNYYQIDLPLKYAEKVAVYLIID